VRIVYFILLVGIGAACSRDPSISEVVREMSSRISVHANRIVQQQREVEATNELLAWQMHSASVAAETIQYYILSTTYSQTSGMSTEKEVLDAIEKSMIRMQTYSTIPALRRDVEAILDELTRGYVKAGRVLGPVK